MPYMENHTLYYKKQCPFCQRFYASWTTTRSRWTRGHLATRQPERPRSHRGKKQVPCLVINGKPLYESDDIIAYLLSLDNAAPLASTCAIDRPHSLRAVFHAEAFCSSSLPIHREHTRRRDAEQAVTMRNQVGAAPAG
ncbi:MAG: glutathione S-transferase N-terminal domain-containing protein [Eggerthellaceae bacterium]